MERFCFYDSCCLFICYFCLFLCVWVCWQVWTYLWRAQLHLSSWPLSCHPSLRQSLPGAWGFARLGWRASEIQRSGCLPWNPGHGILRGCWGPSQVLMLVGQVSHEWSVSPVPPLLLNSPPQHESRVLHVAPYHEATPPALPLFCNCMLHWSASVQFYKLCVWLIFSNMLLKGSGK